MNGVLLVGLGGFIGAVLRYIVSEWVQVWSKSTSFPYGTLVVNLLGCLIVGLLAQLAEDHDVLTGETRLFVFVGILGSFTTFSTFSKETMDLFSDGKNVVVLANASIHLIGGVSMVWIGHILPRLIGR